jgi:hypothetical protein
MNALLYKPARFSRLQVQQLHLDHLFQAANNGYQSNRPPCIQSSKVIDNPAGPAGNLICKIDSTITDKAQHQARQSSPAAHQKVHQNILKARYPKTPGQEIETALAARLRIF